MPSVKRSSANATDAFESGEGVPEGAHGQGAEERVQESPVYTLQMLMAGVLMWQLYSI